MSRFLWFSVYITLRFSESPIYGRRAYSRCGPYIFALWLLLSSISFPRLISAVADWMSAILPHMVWPYCIFKMQVWNVLHAARWKCRTQKIAKNSPSAHHRTNLSGYIFAAKARIDKW